MVDGGHLVHDLHHVRCLGRDKLGKIFYLTYVGTFSVSFIYFPSFKAGPLDRDFGIEDRVILERDFDGNPRVDGRWRGFVGG